MNNSCKATNKTSKELDLGHWRLSDGLQFDPNAFGFVYEIITPDGLRYIGQKHMVKIIKRPPLKGKKRRRICKVESDWRKYVSSSNVIKEDIAKNGKKGYDFVILRFCSCKWELTYVETMIQFETDVLFDDKSLNGIINCRIGKPPKHLQEKYKRNGTI